MTCPLCKSGKYDVIPPFRKLYPHLICLSCGIHYSDVVYQEFKVYDEMKFVNANPDAKEEKSMNFYEWFFNEHPGVVFTDGVFAKIKKAYEDGQKNSIK